MILEVKVPVPGESITEVELGAWLVKTGDIVEMDAELVEINSDKATLTVNAEGEGRIEILRKEGDVVRVGEVIAKIDTSAAATPAAQPVAETTKVETVAKVEAGKEATYAKGVASVSAEKMIKDQGLSKEAVVGTGRDGRVTKADVVEAVKGGGNGASSVKPAAEKQETKTAAVEPVALSGDRASEHKKMTVLRRKIAERLVGAKNDTAMLTTFNEVDMQAIKDLRAQYKDKFKEVHGVGLGFMGFFVRACCEAMKFVPNINSQIDGDDMVSFNYIDIGVAVSTDRGLVVPNIRDAQKMSILEVEKAIGAFAVKAREGKITIDDMTGGTFTITNGGVFGSMLSTPILNPPQSAILGMHNIVDRPVVVNGQIVIRPIMYLALSYDHRLVDGKEAVTFLYKVKEFLEDPARLLLGI
ncbi:MAG: 2-oxoglutarate dehydrogenase complex dihydrolipoyllysine-residue succinyltransferase [Bacteroidia bacterium]|nr:2-oxoglutarate dehydrogenase complex dihydrolipoyllysine-residue succinyltransferase [Bacteroidia bacterium]